MAGRGGFYGYRSPEGFRGALREVWFAPGRFFRELDPEGGVVRPALFASLVLYVNIVLDMLLQAVWLREFTAYALLYVPTLGLVFSIILAPLFVAGFTALVLIILDGAPSRAKFGPLFRALGYVAGIGFAFWIPYASFFAILYLACVATIAVRETLGLNWQRAAIAALVPLVALLVVILLLAGPGETYQLLLNPPQE